jgi:hypothetical protein
MLRRLSNLDWPRILLTRRATALLGLAAALSVCALALIHSDVNPDTFSPLKRDAVSIIGAAGVFGFFSLLICMGFFWLRCDTSSKPIRTLWFVLLLFGFFYGSQIAYYAIVYLPAVLKRPGNQESEYLVASPLRIEGTHERIGPFRRVFLIAWGFLLIPVALAVSLPKAGSLFLELTAVFFFLGSALVAVESIAHAVLSLYRSGMNRPPSSNR